MDMENTTECSELTLNALPDDCLECIFCQIQELKTQIQVSKVCARFQDICSRIWRRKAGYEILCLEKWQSYDLSPDDLAHFLRLMRNAIRKINLITYYLHDFLKEVCEDVGIDCLPNVFYFESENVMDLYANDKDVLALIHLLPNIRILKLMPALTGRHLKLCQQLQELYLYHDFEKEYELKNQYIPEIFANLQHLSVLDIRSFEMSNLNIGAIDKCQQLQVLKLNLNALKPALGKVMSLPQLKTLTVMLDQVIDVSLIENVDSYDYKIYETHEFYSILQQKSDKITGIAVDRYFLPLPRNWDENLDIFKCNKLRKFAFCNYADDDEMLEKYAGMRELRLLCCRNWSELTNETLLRLLSACKKLEHLDITYCICITKDFLNAAMRVLRAQRKSKSTLTIYHAMTAIGDGIEKHPSYPEWSSLMNLSTDFPPNSDMGLSYVQRGYEFDFE